MVGGGGGDTFAFNSNSSGSQTIDEPSGSAAAGLDFSQAPAGISINLSLSGPQAAMPASLFDGALTLTLANPLAIDSVLGSAYDDTLIGNANDNTLIGGGGDDLIAGLGGNDVLEGGITRTVFLDFNTFELPGQHLYTQLERNQIQAQLEADYAAFSYTFTQTLPQSGPFTTITFNDPVLVGLEGGIATGIDWRDLDISGTTTLTFAGLDVVPADSGGVNVNNFLGGPGEPASSSQTSSASRPRSPLTSSATSPASSTATHTDRSAPGSTTPSAPTSTIRPIQGSPTPTRRSCTSWPRRLGSRNPLRRLERPLLRRTRSHQARLRRRWLAHQRTIRRP